MMKKSSLISGIAFAALTFALFVLSGCASSGASDASAGAAFVEEPWDVIFKWDNLTDPMSGEFLEGESGTVAAAPNSGFPDIYFRMRGKPLPATKDGAFRLGGVAHGGMGRLIIGGGNSMSGEHPASADTTVNKHIPGQLDLSGGTFRLTIEFKDVVQYPERINSVYRLLLRVFINNNTSSGHTGILTYAGVIADYNEILINASSEPGSRPDVRKVVVTFTPEYLFGSLEEEKVETLKTAFISLHCQNPGVSDIKDENGITITSILLEKEPPPPDMRPKRDVNFDLSKDYLTYREFGAKGDGKTDDFDAIMETHAAANQHGKKVRADQGAVYYIGVTGKYARIETDTDWTGAEFIIDDSVLKRTGNVWQGNSWLFQIWSPQQSIPISSVPSMRKNQAKLNITLPSNSFIVAEDSNTKRYIRRGANQNTGANQVDVIIVDRNGNIDPSAPLIWDFNAVTSMTAYPIDDKGLTVTGGKFTTIANKGVADNEYMRRGIAVRRSNTVIDGITHLITGEGADGGAYEAFIKVENCANITIKNSFFTGHVAYYEASRGGQVRGTYDMNVSRSINLKVINCTQTNNIHDTLFWGIFTSNYSKNLMFDKVKFSRFDAHEGVLNAAIINSELGYQGVSVVGSGVLKVEDTKAGGRNFIQLRDDYGSTWDGEIIIRNCVFTPNNWHDPQIINTWNNGQWDFGYPCTMPETIRIEGFTVEDKNAPSSFGGVFLIGSNNNGAKEPYPYKLTKTVYLSGFQSGKPYRMMNDYIRNQIKVVTN